tara:strand:- start:22 stop:585 length:564 start_codon:yes stop_codon:yes gene_type:complete
MASKPSKKKIVSKKKTVAKKAKTATKPKPAKATAKAAPKKRKRKKQSKADAEKNYVNAKEFYAEIKEYYRTDIIPDHLAESVYKIAVGLSFAPNFINYSYKDEMVGDAVVKMFSALKNKKFNIDTGNNPFSYFTTIAFHAFINRIKKEKKHRETIANYQEAVYADEMNQDTNNSVYVDPADGNSDDQ